MSSRATAPPACRFCARTSGLCGVGAGYSSEVGRWCRRPSCVEEARRAFVLAGRRELDKKRASSPAIPGALSFVAVKLKGGRWSEVVHIVSPSAPPAEQTTVCGVVLTARSHAITAGAPAAARFDEFGCASCARMRVSAEKTAAQVAQAIAPRDRGLDKTRASSPAISSSSSSISSSSSGLGIVHKGRITLQRKLVRCGKAACEALHGPYWYAYWKSEGRTRCKYIGRRLPGAVLRDRRFVISEAVRALELST